MVPFYKPNFNKHLTLSKGKKNAEALDVLLPAFKATALPCQSITGEPLEPPFVPEAACARRVHVEKLRTGLRSLQQEEDGYQESYRETLGHCSQKQTKFIMKMKPSYRNLILYIYACVCVWN